MQPAELVKKHKLKVSTNTLGLCNQGLEIMENSKDPLHDDRHIKAMISNLDKFLMENKKWPKLDFDVLLLSICWHDMWKTGHIPKNPINLWFQNVSEGVRAARIAKKTLANGGIVKDVVEGVAYAIRKHSALQFRRLKTNESRLLRDLDKSEMYSVDRVERAKEALRNHKLLWSLLPVMKRRYKSKKYSRYYFSWFEKEHLRKAPQSLKRLEAILKEAEK